MQGEEFIDNVSLITHRYRRQRSQKHWLGACLKGEEGGILLEDETTYSDPP